MVDDNDLRGFEPRLGVRILFCLTFVIAGIRSFCIFDFFCGPGIALPPRLRNVLILSYARTRCRICEVTRNLVRIYGRNESLERAIC